jgi:hypothetical protein
MLQLDHFAAHRQREAGNRLATGCQRDIELSLDQSRTGHHPKRRRQGARPGLIVEHG